MRKGKAIDLLGGTVLEAAKALGITYQAVDKWPEELPPRIAQRVVGVYALSRDQGLRVALADQSIAPAVALGD